MEHNLAIKSISPEGIVTCETESDISSTNELQTISQVLSQGNNAGDKEIVNVNGIRIGHTDSPGSWGIHSTLPIYSASYIQAGGGYRSSDGTAGISRTHTFSSDGCSGDRVTVKNGLVVSMTSFDDCIGG